MAITLGSVAPIVPYAQGGGTGQQAKNVISMATLDAIVFVPGDIITESAAVGKVTVNNADPASATIIGIAVQEITAPASAGDADRVNVGMNFPGALWEGSLTGGAATDETSPEYTDLFVAPGYGTVEATVTGFAVINFADTTAGTCFLLAYSPAQLQGKKFVSGSSGTVNPRVIFTFSDSEIAQPIA